MTHPPRVETRSPEGPLHGLSDFLTGALTNRRNKYIVLLVWVVILAVASPFAAKLVDVENNDAVAWLPGSAESLKVSEVQHQFSDSDTMDAVVVYHRDGGLTAEDEAKIDADRAALSEAFPDVALGPIQTSDDGQAAIYSIPVLADEENEESDLGGDVETIRELVGDVDGGLSVAVTGPAGYLTDMASVFDGIDSTLLMATASVVTILLLITYRSPILWLLPLATVAFAHQSASAFVYGLAETVGITVNGQSAGILPVLVFGAGTDYALLLIARYREELRRNEDKHVAMRQALRHAGPAILASGGTVIAGLLCLLVADLNSNRGLGPIGAAGVLCAMLAMLTLLPAFLMLAGRRVFWPFVPVYGSGVDEPIKNLWSRIGSRISGRPRPVWVGTAIVLAVMALGLLQIDPSLSQDESFRTEPEALIGQQLISESFPGGAGTPNTIVTNTTQADAVEEVAREVPGVASVFQTGSSTDGSLTALMVTFDAEPSSPEAFDTVDALRAAVHAVPGADAMVGGPDAEARDVYEAVKRDSMVIMPLVLLVVLIILGLLLRAVVAPLVLVATVVLSFGAALGASVLVFDHIFGFGGMDPTVALLGFVFLVALGIDYNIFLMSRVHEEAKQLGTRAGMLKGLAVTGGVITSAGVVLAATFAVLGVLPLVTFAEIGFLVAFGVLLDTLVVRTVLVPALTFDIGSRIWWPSRLSRGRVSVRVEQPYVAEPTSAD